MRKVTDAVFDVEQFLCEGAILSTIDGKVVIGWGERSWLSKEPSCRTTVAFFFPNFFFDQRLWFVHQYFLVLDPKEMIEKLFTGERGVNRFTWSNPYKDLYDNAFRDLKQKFSRGALKKAVPYVFEESQGEFSKDRIRQCLLKSIEASQNQQGYLYGFWGNGGGVIGVTPELLCYSEHTPQQKIYKSVACAGTSPPERALHLMYDPKERKEHDLVVEGIVESISSCGQVSLGELSILRLENLCHLLRPIEIRVSDKVSISSMIRNLHPTPALGAFPREEGLRWLRDYHTKIPRKRYGAPAGYTLGCHGEQVCYVGIRNVQWSEGKVEIGAGGGVVPESDPEREWEEIQLKLRSIKKMLGL